MNERTFCTGCLYNAPKIGLCLGDLHSISIKHASQSSCLYIMSGRFINSKFLLTYIAVPPALLEELSYTGS